ncbi:hypothetical protein GCM10007939_03600 [Amylibacter marinus]|uniref:Uncharacterized protein n=1 Tax=Amylibacter marinus TaxID=1475483 RepID=A0ABQ5VRN6_9RHOB|nr:hypothetical protein [Amylibacter marinus]GLQ34077.1 hypothetical protein GCM10007939_03600 [Amylibacter marinus]
MRKVITAIALPFFLVFVVVAGSILSLRTLFGARFWALQKRRIAARRDSAANNRDK